MRDRSSGKVEKSDNQLTEKAKFVVLVFSAHLAGQKDALE
uniref:Uncharacterized protein n=1 Tax=Candidatus Kentrum sp. MB TaxID=2138164 RepID=A0A450X615_9GAMM|nr:MAG: hypothetical protein BECKMB1821G_GA0114241_100951 [Candidatus Kentron sp. MB]VFK34817.1 MAG: hypothetical protein BECKMB1821I_GA0114274_108517 [Candidatus Kentron sp. MB]VFK74183.1 MAG: hypothetical protein BECKMB1821H_GA0114242_10021 [Candidatus Kentron sp. MB]